MLLVSLGSQIISSTCFSFPSAVARTQGRGKLYEVACLLKPVMRDRVYLLIVGQVDRRAGRRPIKAGGVLLHDQG